MTCNLGVNPLVGFWPLYVSQGQYLNYPLAWLEPDKTTPIPNTDYVAEMQVRQDAASPTPILTLTNTNGGLVLGGANGLLNIVIADSVTQGLPAGTYAYDIKFTPPDDEPFFWLSGPFNVIATVSR